MEWEKKRIKKLAGFQILRPGRLLPIVKVRPIDYTSKDVIKSVLERIPSRDLVLCHGHGHVRHPHLPKQTPIYLDINPVARPDILGDIRHISFMSRLPENYFDRVFLTYCPPPYAFHFSTNRIYRNILRILKPGGELRSHYLYRMLARERKMTKDRLKEKVKFHSTENHFSEGKVIGTMVIMIK